MSNVKVKYGDNAAGVASQLLAAARSLDLETSVVQTTSDGVFLVPEEVADAAGLSYELADETGEQDVQDELLADDESVEVPAGTLEERVDWVADGEDESERTKRANAVWAHEVDTDPDGDRSDLKDQLHVAVYGAPLVEDAPDDDQDDAPDDAPDDEAKSEVVEEPELPIGKALEQALKDAGLSTSGNKAAKQARLAEHQKTKE